MNVRVESDWQTRWRLITSCIRTVRASTEEQLLLREIVAGRSLRVLGFVNAHAMNLIADNATFFDALGKSDILLRDGSGMAILYRWKGHAPGLNMNGTDFIPKLLAAFSGRRVALWGSVSPHLDTAVARCAADFGVDVVSHEHGFHDDDLYVALAASLKPDLIVLGMGMPKQECVANALRSVADLPSLVVCSGAIIDFLGGKVPRAPIWMRTLGIEWTYRLLCEPRRLFSRYVIGNLVFLYRVRTWQVRDSER